MVGCTGRSSPVPALSLTPSLCRFVHGHSTRLLTAVPALVRPPAPATLTSDSQATHAVQWSRKQRERREAASNERNSQQSGGQTALNSRSRSSMSSALADQGAGKRREQQQENADIECAWRTHRSLLAYAHTRSPLSLSVCLSQRPPPCLPPRPTPRPSRVFMRGWIANGWGRASTSSVEPFLLSTHWTRCGARWPDRICRPTSVESG